MPAVLVVDDEAVVCRTLVRALTRGGLTAGSVASGEEALDRIAGDEPAVLVADVYLNGMNGLDLIEVVRDRYPRVHPRVITGRPSPLISERAAELGAGPVVEKPINPEEFLAAVAHLVAEAQAEAEANHRGPEPSPNEYDGYLKPEIAQALKRMLPEYLALVPKLVACFPALDDDQAYDCIMNVVLGWCVRLHDPARIPYPEAVLKVAKRKASTALKAEQQRTAREEKWCCAIPRSVNDAADELLRREFWEVCQEILPLLPDEECRTIIRAFLEGERDTGFYAATLGLAHLPLDAQRVHVQHVKGRLRKTLERNRRIKALAEPLREG